MNCFFFKFVDWLSLEKTRKLIPHEYNIFSQLRSKGLYYKNIQYYNIESNISCRFLCKIKMQYLPIF